MENKVEKIKMNKQVTLKEFWCGDNKCIARGKIVFDKKIFSLLVGASQGYIEDKYNQENSHDIVELCKKFWRNDIKKDLISSDDFFIKDSVVYKIYANSEEGSENIKKFLINDVNL